MKNKKNLNRPLENKELYLLTVIFVVPLVAVGALTDYALFPMVITGFFAFILGKIIINFIRKVRKK